MKHFVLTACAAALGASAFADIRAVTPDPWGGSPDSWQMKRHAEKMAVVTNGGAKVVFIGDSITHFWESVGAQQLKRHFSDGDMRMLNLGTSADRTEHVLWRLTEGRELDGYEAKCVLIMIGTNNTGHRRFSDEPPSDTILGIRRILETVRAKQPKATVVLTAIFPRGRDANDSSRRRNETVNREIAKLCDGKTTFWCDFNDQFLTADGLLSPDVFPDRLHPAAIGYEIWYAAVKPYVDYALSDGKLPAPANRYPACVRKEGVCMDEPAAAFPATRVRSEGHGATDWWLDRLLRNRNQIADAKGAVDIVLFGDSITHNWEGPGAASLAKLRETYGVLDIGYSGDCTEHALWRAKNGELDGYAAKCVMLMIGTNNTWHRKHRPEDIAAGIRKILDVIAEKQPEAVTLLLPIFPVGDGPTEWRRVNNDKVNAIIREFADGKKVRWVDFTAKFLDEKGDTVRWMPDRVHPNAEGYAEVWLPAVEPLFREICGK